MNRMLDTDICIYIIKHKPPQVLAAFLTFQPGEIAISSISVAELMYGAIKSRKPEQNLSAIEHFLMPLTILSFDETCAAIYGSVRADLEKAGTPIGSLDMLIAAHALQRGLIVVTNNTREFTRVAGLVVENWTTS